MLSGFFHNKLFNFSNIAILNPQGTIALAERQLIIEAVALMLVIVIPVFILFFIIIKKNRVENNETIRATENNPEGKHSWLTMAVWWIAPAIIIFFLAILTWNGTHALDPYNAIQSDVAPLNIKVVALRWKWLFIYPDQDIATVNFLEIPVNTPVHFDLTADDAPMNSLWIPQLGGQMYTMTGMSSQLNLMATNEGDFSGASAEMSGSGFAGMKFNVQARSQADFDQWVASVKQSPNVLDDNAYNALLNPSENVMPNYYSEVEDNLYDDIIMKYMPMTTSTAASTPSSTGNVSDTTSDMNMGTDTNMIMNNQ